MGRRRKCKAKLYEYYVEDEYGKGLCHRCEHCSAGSGWNSTDMKMNPPDKDGEHGDRGCYKCIPCPHGYYREHNSSLDTCSRCRRSCADYHRYVVEECGGHTKGHCGSCVTGYHDPSRNNQQICTRLPDVLEITTTPQKATRDMNMTGNVANTMDHPSITRHGAVGYISGALGVPVLNLGGAVTVLAVVVVVAVAICCICLLMRKRRTHKTGRSDSMLKVISSDDSGLCQENVEIGDQVETDCEVDTGGGYAVTYNSKADPELTLLMSQHGPECHHEHSVCEKKKAEEQQYYPSFRLDKNSKYLTITAKHPSVYGEQIDNLFKYLEVSPQTDFGEKNLYMHQKYGYAEYILKVLMVWASQDGSFDVLCHALDRADLKAVSATLMQHYNGENTPATS